MEVDEEEGDEGRRVRPREREQPREEELALAASGRAGDERVRTVRDEVERDRPVGGESDDDRERGDLLPDPRL